MPKRKSVLKAARTSSSELTDFRRSVPEGREGLAVKNRIIHLHGKDKNRLGPLSKFYSINSNLKSCLATFFFFSFCLFRAAPTAYGSSQARGRIGATAAATATATPDQSHVFTLHHGSQQRRFLNPLTKARDQTLVLKDASQVH